MPAVSDYGTWKSPISSSVTTESCVSFEGLQLDGNVNRQGTVYWTECRYDDGGTFVLCSATVGKEGITEIAPDFSARTTVHEYGGGSFIVQDGTIYASEFKEQQLHMIKENNPVALSLSDSGQRFADGYFDSKHDRIYIVCEDHGVVARKEAKEAQNYVAVVNPKSTKVGKLIEGCDFYSSPRVSPDGTKIVWIQWCHPDMPWDVTEMWQAKLNSSGDECIPGSAEKLFSCEGSAAMHPRWTPSGDLLYLTDKTGWWNLWKMTPDGQHTNIRPMSVDLGYPHWTFALNYYAIDPNGSSKVAVAYPGELGLLDFKTGEYKKIETGFRNHKYVQFSSDGHIYCVAGSPTRFPAVIRINLATGQVNVIRDSRKSTISAEYFSIPESLSWPVTSGKMVHGFLYRPKNPDFIAPEGRLPPLLIRAHQGPTMQAEANLNMEFQYFTSRGFAILDVDYRGSCGHGKAYQNELYGNWGIYDVEDCSSGAKYLVEQGVVDEGRVCIDGESAGGYTTLACLAFTDVFKAGASHFGVSDCALLASDTHKFESRYLDKLIAPYNEANQHIYDERSPIKNTEKFSCPIVLFQGDEDPIVPPDQARTMYEKVKEMGYPAAHVLFKGESHGFVKAEHKQLARDGEFYFFGKVLGFEPADGEKGKLEIANLK